MTRVDQLRQERCIACRADAEPLVGDELDEMLLLIPDWEVKTVNGVPRLTRTFRVPDFRQALDLTLKIGTMADEAGHHPVIRTEWGKVTVSWWTQAIRNLHRNDVIMAARTDAVAGV